MEQCYNHLNHLARSKKKINSVPLLLKISPFHFFIECVCLPLFLDVNLIGILKYSRLVLRYFLLNGSGFV